LEGFLKYICLKVHLNNLNVDTSKINPLIGESFFDLLKKLDMLQISSENIFNYKLNKNYNVSNEDIAKINNGQNNIKNKYVYNLAKSYYVISKKILNKEDFVTDLSKYIWFVIKYMLELEKINLTYKIKPSFEERFYTDLGDLAFNLFNKNNLKSIIGNSTYKVLDIGCGNGNLIDLCIKLNSNSQITGIKRQGIVYEALLEKYNNKKI
jgi:hypothetical protein